jgi:hypothetical protein
MSNYVTWIYTINLNDCRVVVVVVVVVVVSAHWKIVA